MTKELEFRVIEEAVGGVALDSAVLIYRGANSTAFATVHPIHHDDAGAASILPGRPMTMLAVARLAKRLGSARLPGGFVPMNLLYQDLVYVDGTWSVNEGTLHPTADAPAWAFAF